MKLKNTLTAALTVPTLMLVSACEHTARIGANPNSYQQKKETFTVTLTKREPVEGGVRAAVLGPILAAEAATLVVNGIKYGLEQEAKRYTATYRGSAFGDSLIAGGMLTVNGFEVERKAEINGSLDTAMVGTFVFVGSSDGTAFRIMPQTVEVKKAKAKLRAGDKDVDIIVKATMNVVAPANGAPQSKQLGTTSFVIKKLVLGQPKEFPGSAKDAEGSDWIPLPTSSDSKHLFPFSLTVEVQETDDFGKWFTKAAARVEANKAKLTEVLSSALSGQ